jgi:programmed cell death 6-interacting protein
MSKFSSTVLALPFKETKTASFACLKDFISTSYNQDPEDYADDFRSLDNLRLSVSFPEAHEESALIHLKYYAQLVYLEQKFVFSQMEIYFTWGQAFDNNNTFGSPI